MSTFATVSDLRDTAAFAQLVENSAEPIQVMKGRERKMVVLSNELYEQYELLIKQAAFEAKLAEAEADTAAGRVRPIEHAMNDARAKYGL